MAFKRGTIAAFIAGIATAATTVAALYHTRRLQAEARKDDAHVPYGPYEAVVKRPLDAALAATALIALSPMMVATVIAVRVKLGNPAVFRQLRPGMIDPETGVETLFEMYKFRSMSNERDAETGELLPDNERLTDFGKALRRSSADELPELINILKGDMAVVGPRPQLVRDMVFMNAEQRRRHSVRPGLSGLAQVRGRNAVDWERRLSTDLEYVDSITFLGDASIVITTLGKVLLRRFARTSMKELDLADDYGDYLLKSGRCTSEEYLEKQAQAKRLLKPSRPYYEKAFSGDYSVLMSVYGKEKPEYLQSALDSMLQQTIIPDEIVLVKDGPLTAELDKVIGEYAKRFPETILVVAIQENVGLGAALNEGLAVCRNDLVARMDADDISKPTRCEKQLAMFHDDPELAIVGSHVDEFVGEKDNIVSTRKVPIGQEAIYEFAKRRSAFNHPAVMFRKSAVLACGGYSPLRRNQDVDLFGRMLFMGCKADNVDEALLWFRSSNELATRRKSWDNTSSYISTIAGFQKMGYSSRLDVVLVATAQVAMHVMPTRMQQWCYRVFLRG